jgi:lysophospholipase
MISYTDYLTTQDREKIRYHVCRCHPSAAKGTVVLLPGRSEFIEKYEEIQKEVSTRAFDVFTIDWRGQGLSHRPLPNRQKGYIDNFDTYLSDLSGFLNAVVLPSAVRPLICLGHSMGGHIVLRFMHDEPGIFDCAVLTSPMIDIAAPPYPMPFVRQLTRNAVGMGYRTAYALGETDYRPGTPQKFSGNPLTSDFSRYMDQHRAIAATPDLAMGGVTYGWLEAAFQSIDILQSQGYPERITIPLLMVIAGADQVVSVTAQKDLCRRMKRCRMILIPDARHEILKEKNVYLNKFWQAFDGFIEENA